MSDEGDTASALRVHLALYEVMISGQWGLCMSSYVAK